jgi:hypothetical protein
VVHSGHFVGLELHHRSAGGKDAVGSDARVSNFKC